MDALARPDATARLAEEQLAALRQEIDAAGWRTSFVRFGSGCVTFPAVLIAGFFVAIARMDDLLAASIHPEPGPDPSLYFGGALALAIAVGVAASRSYRSLRFKVLRDRLERLPEDDRAKVLRPLIGVGGDSGRLAIALFRDLNLPTEMTPAGTPEGSGAEVSAKP